MNKFYFIILLLIVGLNTTAQDSTKEDNDGVFLVIEIEAEYPGGQIAMKKFIADSLVYPKKALRKKVEGMVVVDVMIDEKGNLKEPVVIKGKELGFGLPEEALRVVGLMPKKWKPARREKKPARREAVSSMYRIPIEFSISKYTERK